MQSLTIHAVLLGVLVATDAAAQQPEATHLIQVNFDVRGEGVQEIYFPKPGHLAQISLIRTAKSKNKHIRTLKVEIMGDGVVEIPGIVWITPALVSSEYSGERHLSCFLKSVKNGKATIKITPIGFDGKARDSREWVIRVGPGDGKKGKPMALPLPVGGPSVPPPLIHIDFDSWRKDGPEIYFSDARLARISLIRSAVDKDEGIRMLKVEIANEKVAKVWANNVILPVRKKIKKLEIFDPTKRDVSVFFRAVGDGKTTIKITPVGEDGKDRPSRDWVISVAGSNPKKGK